MALNSMDDKILGEKTHYYCSSDEEEYDDVALGNEELPPSKVIKEPKFIPAEELSGKTMHTGKIMLLK